MAGKNRLADEFDGQLSTTKQPIGRKRRLSATKLPAGASFLPIVPDPLRSYRSRNSSPKSRRSSGLVTRAYFGEFDQPFRFVRRGRRPMAQMRLPIAAVWSSCGSALRVNQCTSHTPPSGNQTKPRSPPHLARYRRSFFIERASCWLTRSAGGQEAWQERATARVRKHTPTVRPAQKPS